MTEEKHEIEGEGEVEPKEKSAKPARRETVDDEVENEGKPRVVDASSYAPIVGEYQLGRFEFLHRRQSARPWVGTVFVLANGRLVARGREQQPTVGELLWGGYRTLYEVDMSLRQLDLDVGLPSAGDAFAFRASVDVQWRVLDPALIVGFGVTDIRKVLVPSLLDGLRQATRSQKASDVEAAETAANTQFGHGWLSDEYGLWTKVTVRLRMDRQKERNVRLKSEVKAFKTLIAGGDLDQFALQLAMNPQDVNGVVRALVNERDTHRHEVFEFITKLIASDALDRWQIDDEVRVALLWLQTSIYRVISGTDEARKFSYAGSPHSAGRPKASTNGASPNGTAHANGSERG